MYKYIMVVLILIVIAALFFIMSIKAIRFIKKAKFKFVILKNKLEETYYLASCNNQLLSKLKSEQDIHYFKFDYSWCENNTVICHALGEIDNVLFTECKEAFEKHYNEGCRVFELDFSLTSDNVPVVIHDWDTFNFGNISGKKTAGKDKAMTYDAFSNTKVLGKYTTLTLERFVKLANEYKDTYFIISVKSENQQYNKTVKNILGDLFQKTDEIEPQIKKRYILHAYSFDYLTETMKDFSFKSVIYRCMEYPHPSILAEELKKYGIGAVTILKPIYDKVQCRIFHDNGIKVIGCIVTQDPRDERINYWRNNNADMLMSPLGGKINEKI